MTARAETSEAPLASAGSLGQIGYLVRSPKIRRAIAGAMAAQAGYKTVKGWIEKQESKRVFEVTIRGDDDVYADLHAWLLDHIPPDGTKGIEVRTKRAASHGEGVLISPDGMGDSQPVIPPLTKLYSSDIAQDITIGEHEVQVRVSRDENISPEEKREHVFLARYEQIVFTAKDTAARDAVIDLIRELQLKRALAERTPDLYMATKWGDWNRRNDVPRRALDTVILRDGVAEGLVADLERFLRSESFHAGIGAPWHRGYLLHGPPGMGKTSMVRALATHFGLDLYYVPLGDMNKDADLLNLVSRVGARAVLLLEDVDAFHAAKSDARDDEGEGVSISGLLNALDGVATPHGLITVLTTNNIAALDDALIRVGRVDLTVEIDYLDVAQLQAIAVKFLGEPIPDLSPHIELGQVSAAEVLEVIKKHEGLAELALPELHHLANTAPARP